MLTANTGGRCFSTGLFKSVYWGIPDATDLITIFAGERSITIIAPGSVAALVKYGAQILVLVHKFSFKVVLGVIFSHRLSLLLNIQIEKSDDFDLPIFSASATPG